MERISNLRCVGVWLDVQEGLKGITELEPDLVILTDGFCAAPSSALVERIVNQLPATQVMVVSRSPDPQEHSATMIAGACGYLHLSKLPDVPLFPAAIACTLMLAPPAQNFENILGSALEKGLTTREHEVATLIVEGLSNKEIAEKMEIRPSTVNDHLKRIFWKLDVRSRTEVAVKYSRFLQTLIAYRSPL